ncbi:MAG TPA: 2-oxoacid:ferredoxin oxidoreductase subunit beta, partial [Anaerolineae bacterium]|nr:2-oxoacid:ferredoxin oxidoreductase subunit beta [Anaerolineae bacterium]
EPGTVKDVEMHDGSIIRLTKIGHDYDPTDRMAAIKLLEEAKAKQEFVTGLLYVNEGRPTLVEHEKLVATSLVHLPPEKLRPSKAALDKLNAEYM